MSSAQNRTPSGESAPYENDRYRVVIEREHATGYDRTLHCPRSASVETERTWHGHVKIDAIERIKRVPRTSESRRDLQLVHFGPAFHSERTIFSLLRMNSVEQVNLTGRRNSFKMVYGPHRNGNAAEDKKRLSACRVEPGRLLAVAVKEFEAAKARC